MSPTLERPPRGPSARPGQEPARATKGRPSGPARGIDPRIRARRIDVRRQEGRRRLRVLVVLASVVAVVAVAAAATRSPLLDVDSVRVVGARSLTPDEVRALAEVDLGSPLLDLAPGEVEERIAGHPLVGQVRVSRSWPGTVEVRIVERQAAAMLGTSAGPWAVSADGVVLAAAAPDAALPNLVVGPERVVAAGEHLTRDELRALQVVVGLPASLTGILSTAWLGADGALTFDVNPAVVPGAVVEMGHLTDVPAKLQAIETVFDQVVLDGLAALDVGVPRSPVVRRTEEFRNAAIEAIADGSGEVTEAGGG